MFSFRNLLIYITINILICSGLYAYAVNWDSINIIELPNLSVLIVLAVVLYGWLVTLPLRKYILNQERKKSLLLFGAYAAVLIPLTYYFCYLMLQVFTIANVV
ncbi:MAG: hypothetical protein K2G90_08210 [Muribaculaceae bacterium]|nr:hypothetical protein [Muribaculaceae bacterium]